MTNSITGAISAPPTLQSFMTQSLTASPLSGDQSATGGIDFGTLLAGAFENTAALDQQAQQAIQSHLSGGDVSSVELFSSMKKADLALRTMLQIRNKLLEGFNEIKQMQM